MTFGLCTLLKFRPENLRETFECCRSRCPVAKRWGQIAGIFPFDQAPAEQYSLVFKPGGAITNPASLATAQLLQAPSIGLAKVQSVLITPRVELQSCLISHRLRQPWTALIGGPG